MRHEGYESFWTKLCQALEDYGKLSSKRIKNNYGAALHNKRTWNDTDWWFALDCTKKPMDTLKCFFVKRQIQRNLEIFMIFWISIDSSSLGFHVFFLMYFGCKMSGTSDLWWSKTGHVLPYWRVIRSMKTLAFFRDEGERGVMFLCCMLESIQNSVIEWTEVLWEEVSHGDGRFQELKVQNWRGLSKWRYLFNFRLYGLGLLILKKLSFSTWYFPFGDAVFLTMSALRALSLENPRRNSEPQLPRFDYRGWSVRAQTFYSRLL